MKTVVEVDYGKVGKFMAGKVFPKGGKLIFFHENVSVTQWHDKFQSPGGFDVVVIDWLLKNGVDEIHHWDRQRGILYCAPVKDFKEKGLCQFSRGQERLYLPESQLAKIPVYRPPWIDGKVVLNGCPKVPPPSAQATIPGF